MPVVSSRKVNNSCVEELPLRSRELPVHPELITTEGGEAVKSHIFELPRKILSRDEFPTGQDMDIWDRVTRVEEPLLSDQVAFFASTEKLLSESWEHGEVVFVGGDDVLVGASDVFVGARIVFDAVDVGLATNPGGVLVRVREGVKSSVAIGLSGDIVSVILDAAPCVDSFDPMSFVSVGFGVIEETADRKLSFTWVKRMDRFCALRFWSHIASMTS